MSEADDGGLPEEGQGKLEQSRGEPQQAKAQELKKRNNQNRVDLN